MSVCNGKRIVTDELSLCLDASNLKSYIDGSSTWHDMSKEKNNATLFGVERGASVNSVMFSSNGHHGVISNYFVQTPSTLTVSSWFSISSGGGIQCVLHKNTTGSFVGGSEYWIGTGQNSNRLCATIGATEVGWRAGLTDIDVPHNTWVYVCATWNGSVVKVYVNGKFIKLYNLPSLPTTEGITLLGASSTMGAYQFFGELGKVEVYNKYLSAAEIFYNYMSNRKQFGV